VKFCDSDGNAYVLIRIPLDEDIKALSKPGDNLFDQTKFAVPGVESLGDEGLDIETVATISEKNQEAHGYFGLPGDEDLLDLFNEIKPEDVDLKQAMLFNLPVCFLDKGGLILPLQQSALCGGSFEGVNVDKCIFTIKVLCGCPHMPPVKDKGWPYATGGDGSGTNGPCDLE